MITFDPRRICPSRHMKRTEMKKHLETMNNGLRTYGGGVTFRGKRLSSRDIENLVDFIYDRAPGTMKYIGLTLEDANKMLQNWNYTGPIEGEEL